MVVAPPLHDPARDLYVVPIRHHSPACSAQLAALLEEVGPTAILIEGPCDFDPLIPLLCDDRTRAPVAIVALRQLEKGGDGKRKRVTSYFPFCDHSPEFLALRHGAQHDVPTRFIDLPSHARAMLFDSEGEVSRTLVGDETPFDSGDYVLGLARELGCRDGNEVWDQLFETRLGEADWRRFFADVGQYCACIRAATADATMAADGTLEREAQMRALVAEVRQQSEGPIVAIVGGFHAGALFEPATVKPVAPASPDAAAYLVRYGQRQLDALSGYSAGLPLPGFYQRWWDWHRGGGEPGGAADWATALIGGFAAHQRAQGRGQPFPVMLAAIEQAQRLASLRGRELPLRDDIIDAVRSTFVKEEIGRGGHAMLGALADWLTGNAIGDVPPAAGSPPLVEAVRAEARRLRFSVDDGEIRVRNFDIYRKAAHREASRFCHALSLLGAGFGQRTAGPDFRNDVALDRLFEVWSVGWSPMVEARLVELSELADTLPEAVAAIIAERIGQLTEQGLGRNAEAAIDLFATACRSGVGDRAGAILELVEAEVIEDAELRSVVAALSDAVLLRRGHAVLAIEDASAIDRLVQTIWRRVLALVPELAAIPADQARPALLALADLRGIIEIARSAGIIFDLEAFTEALDRLEARDLAPQIAGAVMAFALVDGRADGTSVGARLRGELAGAYVQPAERLGYLGGIIAIARELLWTVPEIVDALDAVVSESGEEEFVALLPHLRLALMPLDPGEIDRLSSLIAERLGIAPTALARIVTIGEDELLRNAALDQAMARKLEAEGVA